MAMYSIEFYQQKLNINVARNMKSQNIFRPSFFFFLTYDFVEKIATENMNTFLG